MPRNYGKPRILKSNKRDRKIKTCKVILFISSHYGKYNGCAISLHNNPGKKDSFLQMKKLRTSLNNMALFLPHNAMSWNISLFSILCKTQLLQIHLYIFNSSFNEYRSVVLKLAFVLITCFQRLSPILSCRSFVKNQSLTDYSLLIKYPNSVH